MAVSAALVARVLLSAATTKEDNWLKHILTACIAALIAVCLLLSAILSILSTPEELDGTLGSFREQFGFLVADAPEVSSSVATVVDADIATQTSNITNPQRKAIIQTALSLVGKVPYFWGGKSKAGWNDAWGKPQLVTAEGSSSTGKYKPYGLDCSGFVDWVYRTSGVGDMLSPSPYGGIRGPWRMSHAIAENELLPGDLVIMYDPAKTSRVNHIGIFYKHDDTGKNVYIHCSSSGNGVVMNSFSGFKYFRRIPALEP